MGAGKEQSFLGQAGGCRALLLASQAQQRCGAPLLLCKPRRTRQQRLQHGTALPGPPWPRLLLFGHVAQALQLPLALWICHIGGGIVHQSLLAAGLVLPAAWLNSQTRRD